MSATAWGLAEALTKANAVIERQAQEIARLTERCDAYREALERVSAIARARILCDPAQDGVLRDIDNTISTALASPAQEQKDKTP